MGVRFRSVFDDRESLSTPCNVNITRKGHEQIVGISRKTGLTIKEVANELMTYALENIEWEK